MPSLWSFCVAAAVALAIVVQPGAEARASTIDQGLQKLADNISQFHKNSNVGQGGVFVTDFEMKFGQLKSIGKSLSLKLSEKLKAKGVPVADRLENAQFALKCICDREVDDSGLALHMTTSLEEAGSRREITGFRNKVSGVTVDDNGDVSLVAGLTNDLTTAPKQALGATSAGSAPLALTSDQKAVVQEARNEIVAQSATQPTAVVAAAPPKNPAPGGTTVAQAPEQVATPVVKPAAPGGAKPVDDLPPARQTVVSAAPDSKFRMEILVKVAGEFVPVAAEVKDGNPFVGFNEGAAFAVRIYNDNPFDVAVRLNLDGINSLDLCEVPEFKQRGVWVIPRNTSGLIQGWLHRANEVKEFLASSYPNSLAAARGIKADGVGLITAQFFPAWTESEAVPAVELAGRGKGPDDNKLAVGVGKSQQIATSNVKRFVGDTNLANITVRFDRAAAPADLPPDLAPK